MKIYNSLSRKIEEFVPMNAPTVTMYTCGPTVYDFSHIGHGRKYVNDDVLKRALIYLGYTVKHVENITDVGHLVSDADEGDDKLEKGAAKTGKTVWEVALFYTEYFLSDMDRLNVVRPTVWCKASEHIPEQIALVKKLFEKGYAYDTPEAVYFDVSKFVDYGKLFGQNLTEKKTAVREEVVSGEHKRSSVDFALWFKRVGRFANHMMHWDSPWGGGFPGWHLECSAMSMKYLGEQFDIHTGGEDHLSVHHPNEIAQSEGATEKKPFVKYWVHHAFLMVNGAKMSKSLGNYLRVEDVMAKNYDPLSLRYLYLTAHYRKPLNFTWEGLSGAATALSKLRQMTLTWRKSSAKVSLTEGQYEGIEAYKKRFKEAIENDLNMPEALAVLWDIPRMNVPDYSKYELVVNVDQVLGLRLEDYEEVPLVISPEVEELLRKREALRVEKKFEEADKVREQIEALGYKVRDADEGAKLIKE